MSDTTHGIGGSGFVECVREYINMVSKLILISVTRSIIITGFSLISHNINQLFNILGAAARLLKREAMLFKTEAIYCSKRIGKFLGNQARNIFVNKVKRKRICEFINPFF